MCTNGPARHSVSLDFDTVGLTSVALIKMKSLFNLGDYTDWISVDNLNQWLDAQQGLAHPFPPSHKQRIKRVYALPHPVMSLPTERLLKVSVVPRYLLHSGGDSIAKRQKMIIHLLPVPNYHQQRQSLDRRATLPI
jgi:hypothetical protein